MNAQIAPAASTNHIVLDPVLSALKTSVPAPRYNEAALFAEAFYARLTPEEYALRDAADWAALARGFLQFARSRKPGQPAIRVFNPNREEHGWESPHTVIQIANDDMPFLVDSVGMVLAQYELGIHVLGHPVLAVRRDPGGNVLAFGEGSRESLMHIEVDRLAESSDMVRIAESLRDALDDVRCVVADWKPMHEKLRATAAELATVTGKMAQERIAESRDFLEWAADDHFILIGYREYAVEDLDGEAMLKPLQDTGLGLLRSDARAGKPRSVKVPIR